MYPSLFALRYGSKCVILEILSVPLQPQPLVALHPDTDPENPDKKRLTCIFLPQQGPYSPSLGTVVVYIILYCYYVLYMLFSSSVIM